MRSVLALVLELLPFLNLLFLLIVCDTLYGAQFCFQLGSVASQNTQLPLQVANVSFMHWLDVAPGTFLFL